MSIKTLEQMSYAEFFDRYEAEILPEPEYEDDRTPSQERLRHNRYEDPRGGKRGKSNRSGKRSRDRSFPR